MMMESKSNEPSPANPNVIKNIDDNAEDDDEHFCIKCKHTIKGLEQYILHRRSECTKVVGEVRVWWCKI